MEITNLQLKVHGSTATLTLTWTPLFPWLKFGQQDFSILYDDWLLYVRHCYSDGELDLNEQHVNVDISCTPKLKIWLFTHRHTVELHWPTSASQSYWRLLGVVSQIFRSLQHIARHLNLLFHRCIELGLTQVLRVKRCRWYFSIGNEVLGFRALSTRVVFHVRRNSHLRIVDRLQQASVRRRNFKLRA
jgi:hypothetical protein